MLCQFDLQPTLTSLGARREHVEDERRAVDDLDLLFKRAFQVTLLRRSQFVVAYNRIDALGQDSLFKLLQLAPAEVVMSGLLELLSKRPHHLRAGGPGQLGEF